METASAFKGCGVKTRTLSKLGQRKRGFSRLELIGLQADLEAQIQPESEQAPLRTWGCRQCFEVFDSTERAPECPACSSTDTGLKPPSKAPATVSARTASLDNTVRDVVESFGMTDYTNQRPPPPPPVIQSPTGPVTMARNGDIGAALGRAAPGSMSLALASGTGKAVLNPSLNSHNMLPLPPKRGTQIVARETRPLPSVR